MPLAELPHHVTFTLEEVAEILYVVDIATASSVEGTAEHRAARSHGPADGVLRVVQRLITSRLWPDLGELLDDDNDGEQ